MALRCPRQHDVWQKAALVSDAQIPPPGSSPTIAAATTIGRSNTALGAFCRRLSARIRKQKALTATARKIAIQFCKMQRVGIT